MNQEKLPDWIVSLDHNANPDIVGTKAYNLARLHASGFNVPPALIISTFEAQRFGIDNETDYLKSIR